PRAEEACGLGLAPTTSTTMMMAMGDVLAVCLLERRGFSVSDFHTLHPSGHLGQQLRRVDQLMHAGESMPLIPMGTAMSQAIIEMPAKRLGCVGIAALDGTLQGVITDGDLRRHMATDLLDRRVEEVMTRHPRTIRPDATVGEAVGMMSMVEPRVT